MPKLVVIANADSSSYLYGRIVLANSPVIPPTQTLRLADDFEAHTKTDWSSWPNAGANGPGSCNLLGFGDTGISATTLMLT